MPPVTVEPSSANDFGIMALGLQLTELTSVITSPAVFSSVLASLVLPIALALKLSHMPPVSARPFGLPSVYSLSQSDGIDGFFALPLMASGAPGDYLLSSGFVPPLTI